MKQASSGLPSATAILAIVLAAFLAGCSTTRDHEEEFLDAEKAAALVGKLDEALIGTSGPDQVEDAIETLDEQTQSDPPLVRELAGEPPSLPASSDIFERIRDGLQLADVEHDSIDKEQSSVLLCLRVFPTLFVVIIGPKCTTARRFVAGEAI